ncbi:MAG: cell division protein ZapA [Deltaproteobacteria bacterium]|nr:cell division protein ZapA [Deltaproteobacteria bacterium]MBW1739267.1 cell division protein ZapA [Deltaproteobacteria bacterium]MBW1908784.1 cell division protein ZapA [Deltaproteobacteria bacterium]MBW2032722.1 cell division protein ZapA [Deltaproteobacteria bacterium]MBW2113546.1 cell division protein ZapA [Deltaproteobacteria bacterium]
MEKPIKVKIFNHEYLIKSDEDEEQVQNIAKFLNDRFREIREDTKDLSEGKTAILAAFHIASDYFHVLKERDDLVRDIQNRARSLNYQIDSIST